MKYLILVLLTPFYLHTANRPNKKASSFIRGYSWHTDLSVYTPDISLWKINYHILEEKLTITRGNKTKATHSTTFLNYCLKKSNQEPKTVLALHTANTIRKNKQSDKQIQRLLYHLDTFINLNPETRSEWQNRAIEHDKKQSALHNSVQRKTLDSIVIGKLNRIINTN
jgi:hypothetical protein